MTFGHDVFGINNFAIFKADVSMDDWKIDTTNWTLKSINALCPDKTGGDETCGSGPFTEFTIRGNEGTSMDDNRWWWVNSNTLGLSNYDGEDDKSGACEIRVRDGYMVKLKVQFETKGEYGFMDNSFNQITTQDSGILNTTTDSFTALLKGGDQLSIDIDSDWAGTARFYLKVQGKEITDSNDSIDDEVYVTLEEVYVPKNNPPANGNGGNGGSSNGGGNGEPEETNWLLYGGIGLVLLFLLK
tara:strand:- start:1312 stop:2040 length:729 start_codon:yes stop_codon:yes gene_type:complete